MWRPLAVILIVLLTGCGTSQPVAPAPPPEPVPEDNPQVLCVSPRPQVCTMEYDPVCASLEGGGVSVYSSPCNACADDTVIGYLPGACADD